MEQKRVIAVHDISCVGRCSLTVALPVLSAFGLETSVLPTAVLSTHTGGFTGYTFRDLTDDIAPILAHWQSLDLTADAVYTGYLGSFRQIELVGSLINTFRTEKTFVMIDPVMGDCGKLYANFNTDFAHGMRDLCRKADMIVPNITEASFMLDEPYRGDNYDRPYIEGLLRRLSALGPRCAVLSGIGFSKGKTGAMAYDRETDTFCLYQNDLIEGYYHGTGDVFASVLLGSFLRDGDLSRALQEAADFTAAAIRRTHDAATDARYGVAFEQELWRLTREN